MTVHEKFVKDMDGAGIETEIYSGRFFWEGPAAHSDQHNGPTLQDIIKRTAVPLQWDSLDSNYVVYPVGTVQAGWNNNLAASDDEEIEPDGYVDGYAARPRKDDEDEDWE